MNIWKKFSFLAAAVMVGTAGCTQKGKDAGGKTGRGKKQATQDVRQFSQGETINFVQKVTVSGKIHPIRSTLISAPYDGYIRKIYVTLGQKVHKGAPLVSVSMSLTDEEAVFPIRSPFDGTVVQIQKTEGEAVKQNGNPSDYILRVDDLTQMFVNALAPEMDISKVKIGDKCQTKASAVANKSYEGAVRDIALAAQYEEPWNRRSQVEYAIKIAIAKPDEDLKSGMSALVDITTYEKPGVFAIQHEYIFNEGEEYFVFLKSGERRQVKIGMQNETYVEILSGLKPKETIQQVDFLKLLGS